MSKKGIVSVPRHMRTLQNIIHNVKKEGKKRVVSNEIPER